MSVGVMTVGVMTVGVMSVGEITVGVMTIGVMRRPLIIIQLKYIAEFEILKKKKNTPSFRQLSILKLNDINGRHHLQRTREYVSEHH